MNNDFIKIGKLAKLIGVLPSTINFYTSVGLIKVGRRTLGGYRLYEREKTVKIIKYIQQLQQERRLTIAEIKASLKNQDLSNSHN